VSRVEIIAEAGVSHNGKLDLALKLVDAAKTAGADVVKFQTYSPEAAIHPQHRDFEFLKSLALPHKDFLKLKKHCDEAQIEFLSTPGDLTSLKFLVEECGVCRIKIGSDDLTYRPLLLAARATGLPVILSTGMATEQEIWVAVATINPILASFTLLHCVSSYPCAIKDANLRAIPRLREKAALPVGYSDHCQGYLACLTAVALGAVMIEKHFELRDHKGPDHEVSITEYGLRKMVKRIREVETMLGTGIKSPCEAELRNIPLVRKREDGRKMA
jgi:N,N'-diacetyllegionaminate synthase